MFEVRVKRKFFIFSVALACSIYSLACQAASVELVKGAGADDDSIRISGEILSADVQKFKAVVAKSENAVVYLDSPGGDLEAAVRIGRLIHALGYFTAVDETQCASACALIWLAGQFKFLTANAKVGFHLPAYHGQTTAGNEASLFVLVGGYLVQLGFSESVIARITSTPSNRIEWLTRSNAKTFGISIMNFN